MNPTIEKLTLFMCDPYVNGVLLFRDPERLLGELKDGDLPNLREFEFVDVGWTPICMVKPPLQILSGLWLDENFKVTSAHRTALEAVSKTLTTVRVTLWDVCMKETAWITRAAPNATVVKQASVGGNPLDHGPGKTEQKHER
ncbi:hypothetical protein JAAARDRAFT_50056 [Jaapia argillacea MUCL 33604]|uniref:Uncharacterized protein n=1 Tax=Jaapia argillacea MUCL 33604 TaxID=933084 RepID=A0A067PR69_9AGAM|nr:hypothetical protein JAAARDRAFT_50056 [Jaapia argillacea MUCL 33604]